MTATRFSMLKAMSTSEFRPCSFHFLSVSEHALMIVKSGLNPSSFLLGSGKNRFLLIVARLPSCHDLLRVRHESLRANNQDVCCAQFGVQNPITPRLFLGAHDSPSFFASFPLPLPPSLSQRYLCNVDCENYPDSCISEKLYMRQAELLVSEGYASAGYDTVSVDDCWSTFERDPVTRQQVADPVRFPNGIKALANYVHGLGLKFGFYSDIGTHTCGGYVGMADHLEIDAQTFASWGVDYLKVDGCYEDVAQMDAHYSALSGYLNATGRPIVYSCSWPAYITPDHGEANDGAILNRLSEICHTWRNFDDVEDSWASVQGVIDWWKRSDTSDPFIAVARPGSFNDADMLMLGNNGLSHSEERTQFALWAIFSSPLFMSNNLATVSSESKKILLNKEIIAVNQDSSGRQGILLFQEDHGINGLIRIWAKELEDKSFAIALQNGGTMGAGIKITFKPELVGWASGSTFKVEDLFEHKELGEFKEILFMVEPSNVEMIRVVQ